MTPWPLWSTCPCPDCDGLQPIFPTALSTRFARFIYRTLAIIQDEAEKRWTHAHLL